MAFFVIVVIAEIDKHMKIRERRKNEHALFNVIEHVRAYGFSSF